MKRKRYSKNNPRIKAGLEWAAMLILEKQDFVKLLMGWH